MFEKEAEKYAKGLCKTCKVDVCRYSKIQTCVTKESLKQAYLAGAEFGYNKCNEWHYPSKGEYPKECENVLCYCKVVDVEFYSIGHTIIGGDNKIRWWSSNRSKELNVYAWKEIVLPKEIEEK